jgi:hypothetical protein
MRVRAAHAAIVAQESGTPARRRVVLFALSAAPGKVTQDVDAVAQIRRIVPQVASEQIAEGGAPRAGMDLHQTNGALARACR